MLKYMLLNFIYFKFHRKNYLSNKESNYNLTIYKYIYNRNDIILTKLGFKKENINNKSCS